MKRVFKYLDKPLTKHCGIYADSFAECPQDLEDEDSCEVCLNWTLIDLGAEDMVLAINKMRENGDWLGFVSFAEFTIKEIPYNNSYPRTSFWLFGNPDNFFKLMDEAIEKNIIGEKK